MIASHHPSLRLCLSLRASPPSLRAQRGNPVCWLCWGLLPFAGNVVGLPRFSLNGGEETHSHFPFRHREERSDVAIQVLLNFTELIPVYPYSSG